MASPNADALVGTPLMDVFDADAHAALKGALVACLQGKWSNHRSKANALLNDGSSVPLEMELSRTEFDGEPAVRLCFAARKRESGNLNEQLTEALERDASTGALQRTFFIEHLQKDAGPAHQGGRARAGGDSAPTSSTASARTSARWRIEDFISQFAGLIGETASGVRFVRPLRRRHAAVVDGTRHRPRH